MRPEDRPTTEMPPLEVERFAEIFNEARPTTRMPRLELEELLADEQRPLLRVIVTPPELRAQWQRWCTIRQALLMTMAIVAALVAFGVLV